MKKSRFTESQIVAVLKEGEAGVAPAELARRYGISRATYFNFNALSKVNCVRSIIRRAVTGTRRESFPLVRQAKANGNVVSCQSSPPASRLHVCEIATTLDFYPETHYPNQSKAMYFKRKIQNARDKRALMGFKIDSPLPSIDEILADSEISEGLQAPQERGRPEQRHPPKQRVAKGPARDALLNKLLKGVTNSVYLPVPFNFPEETYRATIEMHLDELDPFHDLQVEVVAGPITRGGQLYSLHVARYKK